MTDSIRGNETAAAHAPHGLLPNKFKLLALSLSLFTMATVGAVIYWLHQPQQLVAVVDLQQLLDEEQQRYFKKFSASGPKNSEEWSQFQSMAKGFTKNLAIQMDLVSKECECVLLNRAAVLSANAPDMTHIVRGRLHQ